MVRFTDSGCRQKRAKTNPVRTAQGSKRSLGEIGICFWRLLDFWRPSLCKGSTGGLRERRYAGLTGKPEEHVCNSLYVGRTPVQPLVDQPRAASALVSPTSKSEEQSV